MAANELEEGQIVLCTVDSIVGTSVFVKIEGYGEGTISTSEISPGRIRNLRDFVVPGKKIVCKVLNIKGDKTYLSLRRVKQLERKELLDKISKEKSFTAIIRTVVGKEEAINCIEKITENQSIIDFFEKIKTDPLIVNNYFDKQNTEKILKILETKKDKPKEIKHIIKLSNKSSNGIIIIKDILTNADTKSRCMIHYIGAGRYRISISGNDLKELKTVMNAALENIEKKAKKSNSEFLLEKN